MQLGNIYIGSFFKEEFSDLSFKKLLISLVPKFCNKREVFEIYWLGVLMVYTKL